MTAQPTAEQTTLTPEQVTALLAEMDQMRAALSGLGIGAIAPPEPRFSTLFDLVRELARRTLGGDVLHEFLGVVDTLAAEADDAATAAADAAEAAATARREVPATE